MERLGQKVYETPVGFKYIGELILAGKLPPEDLWPARGAAQLFATADELAALAPLTLLTVKPVLYAANVSDAELTGDEGGHLAALREAVKKSGEHAEIVPFSAKIEAELAELPADDRAEFLSSLGIDSAGLDRLIRAGYHLLGLQTYFTAGEQEVRARHILVETEDEAKAVKAELDKGADFAEIAKKKSKDPGSADGGDLGFFTLSLLPI